MSEGYDNTNSGALFRNDKGDNPKRPDYKGSLNVGGVDYWISGWIRESKKDGKQFMSLKVELKGERMASAPTPIATEPAPLPFDDKIPF